MLDSTAHAISPKPLSTIAPMNAVHPVVLSYGLGVDSTAILLRWLTDPTSRDFDLAALTVVTAMTGDEWKQSGQAVTDHVLPLLREHQVRFVQVARGRRNPTTAGDGVVVLDDSTNPSRVHLDGVYRLSDELREAGTIPQTGGARLCSVHAKGDSLDPTLHRLTAGRPYRHVVGFEVNEASRIVKDRSYNTDLRTGEYPLASWGWDRVACEDYITQLTGVTWSKSACIWCPYALGSKAGRALTLARYATDPAAGLQALLLEHTALALNPRQGLIGGARLIDALADAGHDHLLELFRAQVEQTPHALYDVRRILRPRRDDPTKMANASRSVQALAAGSRSQMLAELGRRAGVAVTTGPDCIARAYLRARGPALPATEHFLVAAPAGVLDKQAARFEQWWDALVPEATAAASA